MKRKNVLIASMLSTALLLTGCGEEKASKDQEAEKSKVEEPTKKTEENSQEENNAKDKELTSGEMLNPSIEKESGGKVEIIYTNKEPKYIHDMNGFKVSVDEYQIVKVTDMNQDVTIPFDDQTNGYVVTAKVTLDNQTDKAIYYSNSYRIQMKHDLDYIPSDKRLFIQEEDRLKSKKETETSKFAAGEKITGLISFPLTNEEFESLKTVNPKFVIEGGAADNDQYKNSFKGNATFDFLMSGDSTNQETSQSEFYQDKLTTDNIAEKTLISEKKDLNETKDLQNVKVTLHGYQFTELTPTEVFKESFKDFGDSGVVALTAKLTIENNTDQDINALSVRTKLNIDENRGHYISTSMLEPTGLSVIKKGEKTEKITVFLMSKDEFGIYKKFDLEVGPMENTDAKDMVKGHSVKFNISK